MNGGGVGGTSERGGRPAGVDLQQAEVPDGADQPRGHLGRGAHAAAAEAAAPAAASEDSGRRRRRRSRLGRGRRVE